MARTGRPTRYQPEYAAKLIAHLKDGYSFESFGAVIDVNRDTLYAWLKKHRDFSDARKRGDPHALYFWESVGRSGAAGKLKGFNVAAWIFNMKNRFGWRDLPAYEAPQAQSTHMTQALANLDAREKLRRAAAQQVPVASATNPAQGPGTDHGQDDQGSSSELPAKAPGGAQVAPTGSHVGDGPADV